MHELIESRKELVKGMRIPTDSVEGEGGCGVVGFASTAQIRGKHLLTALRQMINRGNGKGGGIAAVGLDAGFFGIDQETLETHYLIAIAYLDTNIQEELEKEFIFSKFDVAKVGKFETHDDLDALGLDVRPPDVHYYFCLPKKEVINQFIEKHGLEQLDELDVHDEFVYQNSFLLNKKFYSSLGEKKAFVLSHGRNLIVLKIVGFANQVIEYYLLEDFKAHIWVGHHRYPTKGTVWHPGGAHPFIGLNEALVHNGDFANHHAVAEYLAQRNIYQLFLTDTEVAALQFDLYSRVYKYPIEAVIEALAPTTERDFVQLPQEKRELYSKIQYHHLHGSPDGPWFFIVAQNSLQLDTMNLIGITDTSMLRPQVFALQEGEETIGLIASERQAIDAVLRSLSIENPDFGSKADIYWNARGGSHTDGGAFIFSIDRKTKDLVCTNKFGQVVKVPPKKDGLESISAARRFVKQDEYPILNQALDQCESLHELIESLRHLGNQDNLMEIYRSLSYLMDIWHVLPYSKNGRLRGALENALNETLRKVPVIEEQIPSIWKRVDFKNRKQIRKPEEGEQILVLDVSEFPSEGESAAALLIVEAFQLGWSHVVSFDWRGQRFCGSGLGPNSDGFRIDVYGNPGDYLASGLDGAEIYVHTSAQDQVGQIMRRGKLVIYGDVGQTFMYGAKGGEAFILGNAAGRPLINAGGRPRVVINGTCLDYLAESFMAGDPLDGGGFVIVNGIGFDELGNPVELETPYPGSNLFSLASGGAIYIRDPFELVNKDQLNGGQIVPLSEKDVPLLYHYLSENRKHFHFFPLPHDELKKISEGKSLVSYRKVVPVKLKELS